MLFTCRRALVSAPLVCAGVRDPAGKPEFPRRDLFRQKSRSFFSAYGFGWNRSPAAVRYTSLAPQKYRSVKGRVSLKPSNRVGFGVPGLMFSVTENRGDRAWTHDASLLPFLHPRPVSLHLQRRRIVWSPTVAPLSGPTKRALELLVHIVELPDNTHSHTRAPVRCLIGSMSRKRSV